MGTSSSELYLLGKHSLKGCVKMQVVLVILAIVLIIEFWDNIVYLAGGVLILLALLLSFVFFKTLKEVNMSKEEFYEREHKKKEENPDYKIRDKPGTGLVITFTVLILISGLGGYKIIDYNSNRIEANQIAEEQEQQKRYEEEQNEVNKSIAALNEKEMEIYNKYYNTAIEEGKNELEAQKSSLKKTKEDIDKENAELQKKYDDQAKYEEWIAWQESEKKKAEEKSTSDNNKSNNQKEQPKQKEQQNTAVQKRTFQSVTKPNEVYLGEVQSVAAALGVNIGPRTVGVYVIPSSQEETTKGIIFKDKGYKIRAVIRSSPDNDFPEIYKVEFYETSNGIECYLDGREEPNWEKSPPLNLIYEKTNPSMWNKFKSLLGIE